MLCLKRNTKPLSFNISLSYVGFIIIVVCQVTLEHIRNENIIIYNGYKIKKNDDDDVIGKFEGKVQGVRLYFTKLIILWRLINLNIFETNSYFDFGVVRPKLQPKYF